MTIILTALEVFEKYEITITTFFTFPFDYGQGDETARVVLDGTMYGTEPLKVLQPIGLVVLFASQGPGVKIEIGSDVREKLVMVGIYWKKVD